jgi:hypothetical protein
MEHVTEKGWVSLWLGQAVSADALEGAMTIEYSEEGDFLGSEFSRRLRIEFYDDDFREAEMLDARTASVIQALAGFSADETVGPRFVELIGPELSEPFNAVVLLHNHQYDGTVARYEHAGVSLRFMGAVRYE